MDCVRTAKRCGMRRLSAYLKSARRSARREQRIDAFVGKRVRRNDNLVEVVTVDRIRALVTLRTVGGVVMMREAEFLSAALEVVE